MGAHAVRTNIYRALIMNFASILLYSSLVRSMIIQTGNANVNECTLAYLYFPFVELSVVMMLNKGECQHDGPPDMLLDSETPRRERS